jgi:hypothetical protein|tara:strand:+ start:1421 stop:1660 length:240 start_codon:yes stop_codon:yes gene_type:complete
MILVLIILALSIGAAAYFFLIASKRIKDTDGDLIPDVVEDKVKSVKKEVKSRVKAVKEEAKDVVAAAKGTKRKPRSPKK